MTTSRTASGSESGARLTQKKPSRAEARVTRMERTHAALSRAGKLARGTLLGTLGFLAVLGVAGAGWALSWNNLIHFGTSAMGFPPGMAWLVPAVFDGAPLGLSLFIYQARINARSVPLRRLLLWAFVGLSAYINWMKVPAAHNADVLAAILPLAAAVLFEALVGEAHRAAERDLYEDRIVPRITLACWVLDPRRAYRAFKVKTLRPLAAAEEALGILSPAAAVSRPPALSTPDLTQVGQMMTTPAHASGDHPLTTPARADGHVCAHHPVQIGRDQSEPGRAGSPARASVSIPAHLYRKESEQPSEFVDFDPLAMGPAARRDQGDDTRTRVEMAHAENPTATHRELAEMVGVSVSTVRRYRPLTRLNGSH